MAGFRGSGSWIREVAACTLLIRYMRENLKIATFSRLSGIYLDSRPYKIDASDQQPKLKHQVYINVDHSKQSGFQPKISTSSNFQNNHRVS